ncbi:hypothetical protein PJP10_17575 [Mycobacterium kansasii]
MCNPPIWRCADEPIAPKPHPERVIGYLDFVHCERRGLRRTPCAACGRLGRLGSAWRRAGRADGSPGPVELGASQS